MSININSLVDKIQLVSSIILELSDTLSDIYAIRYIRKIVLAEIRGELAENNRG